MVSLTPKHVRGINHRTMRLVCLASSPKKTPEYMLALAIGAAPLSIEWAARCMQDQTLHPSSNYQLPAMRVPGTGTDKSAPAAARGEIGRILPMERRVLRTARGRDPLLLGVRASSAFTKQWYVTPATLTLICFEPTPKVCHKNEAMNHCSVVRLSRKCGDCLLRREPLLRAAGAHCVPVVTSSATKKPPRVHAYLCDGSNPPSAGSRVPCVSLAWLFASLVSQRRRPFNDEAFAVPPPAAGESAMDSPERGCSQQF